MSYKEFAGCPTLHCCLLWSPLLNIFAFAVDMFVFVTSKFASASIQFKPAVNISEWMKCCQMLPRCSQMCQYPIQHSALFVTCAAKSIILIYRVCQSAFKNPTWIGHFDVFLLLTLLLTAGYSHLHFALLNISLSHLLFLSAMNPNACRATGRGLQPKGVRVKEVADFKVFTKGAGSGELHVSVKGPSESDNSLFSASLPTPPCAFLE